MSDLLVFGKRAGEYAAKFASTNRAKASDATAADVIKSMLAPFERGGGAEAPYAVQHDLQTMMQELVGIVRVEEEMKRALDGIGKLKERAKKVGVTGNREYNPGWHTAIDLRHLLTVAEAITRAAIERKESRGGHFRDDHPGKSDEFAKFNIVLKRGAGGEMVMERRPIPAMPAELAAIIEEQKN